MNDFLKSETFPIKKKERLRSCPFFLLNYRKRSKTKDNNLVVPTDNAFSNGNQVKARIINFEYNTKINKTVNFNTFL